MKEAWTASSGWQFTFRGRLLRRHSLVSLTQHLVRHNSLGWPLYCTENCGRRALDGRTRISAAIKPARTKRGAHCNSLSPTIVSSRSIRNYSRSCVLVDPPS